MPRSIKKSYYIANDLLKKIEKALKEKSNAVIKTYSRRSTIAPDMIGLKFEVHNGKSFTKVYVTEDMVGHKLGEFSPTRKDVKHTQLK